LNLVAGKHADGFSLDPAAIHYGSNGGFQGTNKAILRGANPILLVGFNMSNGAGGQRHFFGNHPESMHNTIPYERFIPAFRTAAKMLPPEIKIINCTPDSKLDCFPKMDLAETLSRWN